MNAPTQYEFEFDIDVNVKGEEVKLFLHDPCQTCMKRESDLTVPRTGDGICNICARDEHEDWAYSQLDR